MVAIVRMTSSALYSREPQYRDFHLIYSISRHLAIFYWFLSIYISSYSLFFLGALSYSHSVFCAGSVFALYFKHHISSYYCCCYTSLLNQNHASMSPTEHTPAAPPPIITHDEQPASTNLSLKSQWTPLPLPLASAEWISSSTGCSLQAVFLSEPDSIPLG